jgi:hypothetical protein
MKKLLEDHRSRFGDFEVIDFVDTDEIERLRAEIDIDAPLEVHWAWEYGSEFEELRKLYEKGKVNQWNAETDLDWSTPVAKDDWVLTPRTSILAQLVAASGQDEATQKAAAFDELGYAISQLLHGEQAALQICGQLTNECDTMDEKWYAASQVADEARHIEVLAKFMERKVGTIYPVGPTLKVLLDTLLTADTSQKKTLGMQCLFEGLAVGIFDFMRQDSQNPLFTDMLTRVERDESRHAAFGVLSMRRVVRDASKAEMDEMEDWTFSIMDGLNANQNLDMFRVIGPKYDLDPEEVVSLITSLPNFAELNSLLFMHTVIPNLHNLGLMTERTEDQYRAAGICHAGQRQALPEGRIDFGTDLQ